MNVGRDDSATPGDFGANEFGSDDLGDGGAEGMAPQVTECGVRSAECGVQILAAKVLADGNKLHFGRDDALAGVKELSHDLSRFRAQRLASQRCGNRDVTAAWNRSVRGPGFLDISASYDPFLPQRRQTLLHLTMEIRVTPGPGAIINTDRGVGFCAAVERFSRAQLDLPKWHAHIQMQFSGDENFSGTRQRLSARW